MKNLLVALMLMLLSPAALAGKPTIQTQNVGSLSKPGAPVTLASQPQYVVKVGDRVVLDLGFVLHTSADDVRIELSANSGLMLDQSRLHFELGARDAGPLALPSFAVDVLDEGLSYVNAVVYVRSAGAASFRGFRVSLATEQYPQSERAINKTLQTNARGQMLRVLPATQTN